MNTLGEDSLDEVPSDLNGYFEKLGRELEGFECEEASATIGYDKVRLRCTGQLVEVDAVNPVAVRAASLAVDFVEFTCPSCGEHHDSRLF